MASRSVRHGPNIYNSEEIRIVLVGKTGAGKSATGNTILGEEKFKSEVSSNSSTKQCDKAFSEVDGQKVAVIDTPGLFDTCEDEEKTVQDIAQSISYASPGPHIFLVVIRLGRFTDEEKKTVQMIQQIFGREADKYSMVLFTHGDLLKGKPIEEFLKESKDLQKLVSRCNGQYHVFNNELEDHSQVRELLNKIRKITEKNGGSHYTTEMFQKAEKKIEEEKHRIQKENEEQRLKEQEELKKKIEKKYEEEFRKIEADRLKEKQLKEDYERKLKIAQEKELMEKQLKEDYERQQKEKQQKVDYKRKLKIAQEKELMEKQLKEDYERKLKIAQEKELMEKQLKEDYERKLAEKKAEMEKEKEEALKKLKEEQDTKDRLKAEKSSGVKNFLIGLGIGLGAVASVGLGWGIAAWAGTAGTTAAGTGAAVATASSCCIS